MEKMIRKEKIRTLLALLILMLLFLVAITGIIYSIILEHNGIFLFLSIFALLILPIIFLYVFVRFGRFFPFNSFDEYKMKLSLKEDNFKKYGILHGNELFFCLEENDGIWETKFGDKILTFNLKHYFFQKAYLKAYFLRQFNMLQMNKEGLTSIYLTGSLNLTIPLSVSNVKI